MSSQEILNWGIDVITLLQLFTADFFVLFMKGITLLGNETAYLIMTDVHPCKIRQLMDITGNEGGLRPHM